MLEEKINKWKDIKELSSNSQFFYFVATLWAYENMWPSSLGWVESRSQKERKVRMWRAVWPKHCTGTKHWKWTPETRQKRFYLLIGPFLSSLPDIILLSKIKALGNYTEDKIKLTKYGKKGIVSVLMPRKDYNLESKWNWAQMCLLLFLSNKIVQTHQKNLYDVLTQIYWHSSFILGL